MRAVLTLFLLILFSFCVAHPAFAVPITIDSYPQKITTPEFEISVSIHNAKPATNFVKALIYKDGTHDYVAKTWNGSEWYNGSSEKSYLPVAISGKTTNTTLKVQLMPDTQNGDYVLSVKRYTASGNAGDDTVNPTSITIELPQITPPLTTHTEAPVAAPVKTKTPVTPPPLEETPVVLAFTDSVPSPQNSPETHESKTVLETKSAEPSTNREYLLLALPLFACGVFLEIYGALFIFKKHKQLV